MNKKITLITAVVVAIIVAGGLYGLRSILLERNDASDMPAMVNGLFAEPYMEDGVRYLIPPGDIVDAGVAPEKIPALTNPVVTSVAAMDAVLGDELYGIALVVDGVHRFYPYQIANWHQVINDTVNGTSLLVICDPLSGTAAVYEHTGSFSASGKVYNNTMLMDDGAGSLWLASRGTAVVGDAIGDALKQYPSQSMPWETWKTLHPDGEVLSNDTGHARDYSRHPYGSYGETAMVYFPLNAIDDRLGSKTIVDSLDIAGEQLAFPRAVMELAFVHNDTVGGLPVVALYDAEARVTNVFLADANETVLTFTYDEEEEAFRDAQTDSMWSADGVAIAGELRGTALTPINAPEYYWFAWAAAYPETRVSPLLSDLTTTGDE